MQLDEISHISDWKKIFILPYDDTQYKLSFKANRNAAFLMRDIIISSGGKYIQSDDGPDFEWISYV